MKDKILKQHASYKKGISFQYVEEISLGPIISYSLKNDPIHMSFVLSRYKFVSKMLKGYDNVLEIGCADGFGTPIVAQFVKKLKAIDIDEKLINSNKKRLNFLKNVDFEVMEFGKKNLIEKFDAIYAIDVFEHLDKQVVKKFMDSVSKILKPHGVFIIGTPNITSASYASPQSSLQHINLQSHESLKNLFDKYFFNTFLFSMNDETVHTGYSPMAHYLWSIGVGNKNNP